MYQWDNLLTRTLSVVIDPSAPVLNALNTTDDGTGGGATWSGPPFTLGGTLYTVAGTSKHSSSDGTDAPAAIHSNEQ